jgi:hypothetical protein
MQTFLAYIICKPQMQSEGPKIFGPTHWQTSQLEHWKDVSWWLGKATLKFLIDTGIHSET